MAIEATRITMCSWMAPSFQVLRLMTGFLIHVCWSHLMVCAGPKFSYLMPESIHNTLKLQLSTSQGTSNAEEQLRLHARQCSTPFWRLNAPSEALAAAF